VVASRFGSCQADCASCLNPVATAASLVRALDAYQQEALAQGLIGAPTFEGEAAARLKPGALRRMIRNQRRPVLAQVLPQGRRSFYPPGMSSHFALIVGIAGTGQQARLTVNDPYPDPEASNPLSGHRRAHWRARPVRDLLRRLPPAPGLPPVGGPALSIL